MWWIFFVLLTVSMAVSGVRRAQRAGTWSWSRFGYVIAFLALVGVIVTAPWQMEARKRLAQR
jgi:hypothetical protein